MKTTLQLTKMCRMTKKKLQHGRMIHNYLKINHDRMNGRYKWLEEQFAIKSIKIRNENEDREKEGE